MKRYLARLAARARPPVVSAPAPASQVDDPFSATTESSSDPADSFSNQAKVRSQSSQPPEELRPAETHVTKTTFAISSKLNSQPPPAETTARQSASEAAANNGSVDHPTLRPRNELSAGEGEQSERPATEPIDLNPFLTPGLPSSASPARENPEAEEYSFNAPHDERPSLVPPTEADLLRLADRFMQGLQQATPTATETENSSDSAPPLLPSREATSSSRHGREAGQDAAHSPTVHIGSLRVEIVEPPSAAPAVVPRTRIVVRQGGGNSGRHGTARPAFGLRQL